ncbi:hypothetical protein ACSBR2_035795 [Camellia fascicularis]
MERISLKSPLPKHHGKRKERLRLPSTSHRILLLATSFGPYTLTTTQLKDLQKIPDNRRKLLLQQQSTIANTSGFQKQRRPPVIHRRPRKNVETQGILTVFVDYIPKAMDSKGLYVLFSKFGVVKDAFIPNKRRKVTRSRFGFVRYGCPVVADMAIQKANGLSVDNRDLKVKMAEFGRAVCPRGGQLVFQGQGESIVNKDKFNFKVRTDSRSYADIVKGIEGGGGKDLIARTDEASNGWLYESLIVKLKPYCVLIEFKQECEKRGLKNLIFRKGGGKLVVITFNSKEVLQYEFSRMKEWIYAWCDFVSEWKKDMVIEQERAVWLSCYGVPFNLWSSLTFKNIGKLWG